MRTSCSRRIRSRCPGCGLAWSFDLPVAIDTCEGTNVTLTVVSTVTNGLGGQSFSVTRTWRVIDGCANSSVCSQTVTIAATVPQQIVCSSNITLECAGFPGTPVFFTTTATDICGRNMPVLCTPPSGAVFALGTNLVRCVATDGNGNTNIQASADNRTEKRDTSSTVLGVMGAAVGLIGLIVAAVSVIVATH